MSASSAVVDLRADHYRDDPYVRGLGDADFRDLYRHMVRTRALDSKLATLYRQGKITGGVYTGAGNEASSVGSAAALEAQDWLCPQHRNLGARLARGEELTTTWLQLLGRHASPTRGKDNALHHHDPERRILGMISHLAAMIPTAVGLGLGARQRGDLPAGWRDIAVLNYTGEGASSLGDFHEGLNVAAVWKIGLVLIIDNNQWAYSTPTSKQYACEKLSDRAEGYGIPGVTIDGTNVLEVYRHTRAAVERAHAGEGPTLIESVTMRMRGHSEHDDFHSYVPEAMLEEWARKDPLQRYERFLLREGLLDEASQQELRAKAQAQVEAALELALAAPPPRPENVVKNVYAL